MPEIRHPADRRPDKPEPPPANLSAPDPLDWFDRLVAAKRQAEAEKLAREGPSEGSDTPRADTLRARCPDQFPTKIWDRMCDGVAFDERQQRVSAAKAEVRAACVLGTQAGRQRRQREAGPVSW